VWTFSLLFFYKTLNCSIEFFLENKTLFLLFFSLNVGVVQYARDVFDLDDDDDDDDDDELMPEEENDEERQRDDAHRVRRGDDTRARFGGVRDG